MEQNNPFKTVMAFTFPSEMHVIRSKLESEGIECQVLDETTIQVHNFLSNAIGGVRLQVRTSDLDKARSILKNEGYMNESVEQSSIAEDTQKTLKFIRTLKLSLYTLVGVSLILVMGVIAMAITNRPTDEEKLIGGIWCMDYVVFNETVYYPNTLSDDVQFKSSWNCNEPLKFFSNRVIDFPGFDFPSFSAKWKIENDKMRIFEADTLGKSFEGMYDYEIDRNTLILNSNTAQIVCVRSYN